jgi:hypothetical protein
MKDPLTMKRKHITKLLDKAKRRSKRLGISFDISLDYLAALAPDYCPIFGTPLLWGPGSKRRPGKAEDDSPSIDRIIPEKGYMKGNVAIISTRANRIKSNATCKELYKVADWLHAQEKEINRSGYAKRPKFTDPAFTYAVRTADVVIVRDDQ